MSSSKAAARAAAALGFLALLTLPVAVAAAQLLASVGLLQALYVGVAVTVVLGLAAAVAARRARLARERSVKPGGAGPVRLGRFLAFFGLYVGVTAALALGVYGALRWAQ